MFFFDFYHLSVPCNTTSVVSFTIGDNDWPISKSNFIGGHIASGSTYCDSYIYPHVSGQTSWAVGDIFLKNQYTSSV